MAEQQRVFNFQIKKILIKNIELYPQAIGQIDIYEGITNPGILGNITIMDWQGFDEVGEIFALDDIDITFTTETREELKLKFKIYASSTSVEPTLSFRPVTYKFCSPWLIDAYTRQVSKNYKDKYIHDIVTDLLQECGANIGTIEPTKQRLNRFTTPLWTPLKSIHHLLSFAMNKEDKGGYVLWTDLNTGKTNVTTLDYLFAGKYGKEDVKFMSLPLNEFYEGRIHDLTVESNFDVIKSVNQGMSRTKHQSYYIDKNKIYTFDKAINEIPYSHLSKKLPVNNLFLDKKFDNIKGNYYYPIKDTLVSDDNEMKDMVDGKVKTRYVRLFGDMFKLNILTNPNSSRRAGNICELEYQSEEKTTVAKNKQMSGQYLIRNIRHMIFNGIYRPAVTLIADGLKESKNELITWGS